MRTKLGAWTLPEARRQRLASRRFWPGLAAAAVLLLALGGGLRLSGAQLHYEAGPLRIRLGQDADFRALLAEAEARHERDIEALKASLVAPAPRDDEAVLARVRTLLRETEARHAALLRTSLDDLSQRSETQRRYDLARVSAGLSYLDGKTGQDMARTTELVSYVLKASEKR